VTTLETVPYRSTASRVLLSWALIAIKVKVGTWSAYLGSIARWRPLALEAHTENQVLGAMWVHHLEPQAHGPCKPVGCTHEQHVVAYRGLAAQKVSGEGAAVAVALDRAPTATLDSQKTELPRFRSGAGDRGSLSVDGAGRL
jgi:hypothetical protein